MKKYVPLVLGLMVAAFAALAWGEANPQPSPVNVPLTAAQIQQLNGARGDIAITLTKEQTELIKKTFPNLTATTVTLAKTMVSKTNTIAILVGARGEANPQPSP